MEASRLGRAVRRAEDLVANVAAVLATLCFAIVIGAFAWSIASRYLLNTPSAYSEEIAVVSYLWVVMIGAGLACTLRDHVTLDIFVDMLPPRGAAVAIGLGALLMGLLLLAMLPVTIDYTMFLWREKTAALRWRLDHVYACFPIFQGAIALRLLIEAIRQAAAFRGSTT